jgi:glycosyltransferase involved in cell wall biosynthesis
MKIVLINYSYLPKYTAPEQWINRIRPSIIILTALAKKHEVHYAGQIGYEGNYESKGVQYHFINPGKRLRFPAKLHALVKQLGPDVVWVPGFHFSLQVMQLRFQLGKKVKIILEHHADKPFTGIKKIFQHQADRFVDAYHFTSLASAQEWLDAKIISDKKKCKEIPANSSYFKKQDKLKSREATGMKNTSFLWVGRLNSNKDPMTVLYAFHKLLSIHPTAELHMIFQSGNLLQDIIAFIKERSIHHAIFLHGEIAHEKLETWYSAADFFISASHSEGGSIALVEAMSCGCIPIVSSIPSSLRTIGNGCYGIQFKPGDRDGLLQKLIEAMELYTVELSKEVEAHFKRELSAEAIAEQVSHGLTVPV